MITLQIEFKKIKRKKIGLTMCALMGIQFAWLFWATRHPDETELLQGWLAHLQTQPLLCAIMMPTVMSVLASRLADIEHKGNTYKQLKTLRTAGTLYHAKVLCGFLFIFLMTAANFLFLLLLGYKHGYVGNPNPKAYLLAFLLQIACCFSLYLLQLDLSMLFFNQMIPLVVGLCGSLLGVVLMYLKTYSFLPWGAFLSSALVMMDWNPDTRVINYYYRDFSPVELFALAMIFVWIMVFYTAGRILFTKKES